MNTERNVVLFMDRGETGESFFQHLERRGVNVELCLTVEESLKRARRGFGDIDVVFLHKDLGEPTQEWGAGDHIAAMIRENNGKHARLVVISGEYPDGKGHVLRMGADAYGSYLDLNTDFPMDQIRRGWVLPDEQQRRGETVETP